MADKTAERQPMQPAAGPEELNLAASQLSAMVDGELTDLESDLVLRRLGRDSEARERWERYHLISDLLRGHLPVALDDSFAARIRQAIEAEPPLLPAAKPLPAWYKPVTGFALAASVVLMALFGLKLTQTDYIQPTAQFAASAPAPFLPIQAVASTPRNGGAATELVEARLNSYLMNHNGHASMNTVNGVLPFVRMVGYRTDR
jgi:sigma-E factor negative regulatory protein RseA